MKTLFFISNELGQFLYGFNSINRPIWEENLCKMLTKEELPIVYEKLEGINFIDYCTHRVNVHES